MRTTCSIAVVAVSYFNFYDLERLIGSLKVQTNPSWRLLIVDNSLDAEENQRVMLLKTADSRIQVTTPAENLGYMPSALIATALLPDSDWVVICNSDIELSDPEAFSKISSLKNREIAVVAPKITDQLTGANLNPFLEQAPSQTWTYLRLIGTSNQLAYKAMKKIHQRRLLSRAAAPKIPHDTPRRVFAAHGSLFIMASSFAQSLVNVRFQSLYGEELTLAGKAREAKKIIMYEPEITAIHHSHSATGSLQESNVRKLQYKALNTYRKSSKS